MSRAAVPSFVSEPQVRFLQAVLEEIRDGQLQVPRFQRPFVWSGEQQTELLSSIRDGLPVGAIMVWRTHLTTIACYDRLGPYPLKAPAPDGGVRQYLLDGVQRMTTLYSAFFPPEDTGPDTDEWDVRRAHVDLTSREFIWLDRKDAAGPNLMPLEVVFDAIKLSRFLRKLPETMTAEVDAAEQIAKAFREYKIPVIPIVGDDLDVATRTFQRINSQGTRMSSNHMVHALTWSKDFDLQAKIEELRADHLEPVGWGELDEDRILDVCRLALDLHMLDRNVDLLSSRLRQRPEVIEDAVLALQLAAEFLRADCHILTPDLIPYKEQLALVADAFRVRKQPSVVGRRCLHIWLWLTTYNELFSGSPYRRVGRAVSDVRHIVQKASWAWSADRGFERRNLPPGVDLRTPRGRALAVRLAERARQSADDEAPFKLLAERGSGAVRRMYVHVEPRLRGNPGNYFVVPEEEAAALRHDLEKLPRGKELDALCVRHAVPQAALPYLQSRKFADFIMARRTYLDGLEDRFVRDLVDETVDLAD